MRKTTILSMITTALMIVVGLAATATAAAKTPTYYIPKAHHACRASYRREIVRIKERRHGRVVRRHHKVVYVRQVRCAYVAPKKATTPAAPPAKTIVRAGIDPSYTQDPSDNLKVTWSYSASAPVPLPAGTLSLTVQEPNKAGSSGGCTMNVGGDITGGQCMQELPHYGSWNVTVTYASSDATVAPATSTETEDIEPLPVAPIVPVATTTSLSLSNGTTYSEPGPPPLNWTYEYGSVFVNVSSSDPANAGFVLSLTITGTNSRTLTGSADGDQCVLAFAKTVGSNVDPTTTVSGCGIPSTKLTSGDTLAVSATSTGSTGYTGSSTDTQTVTLPWTPA